MNTRCHLCALSMAVLAVVACAGEPQFADGVAVGTVESGSIDEASGLAASRDNPGVLWVHNDSGDSARVFAMNTAGTHLGIYYLSGASATDWEDMAIGPGPTPGVSYLYVGDIGDNNAVRSSIRVYRVPEPAVDPNQAPVSLSVSGVETITLMYPDGPRDAETLMVDPLTGDLYIVSKRETPSKVYRAAHPQSTSQTITMELVSQLPWGWAVGGDISPDGDEIVIRRSSSASLWRIPRAGDIWETFAGAEVLVPIRSEPQGEAIAFDSLGHDYFTVSEGSYQPIYQYVRLFPLGDANCDGTADVFDIDAFVLAIIQPSGYAVQYAGCDLSLSDCNEDGAADIFDIDAFVAIIAGD